MVIDLAAQRFACGSANCPSNIFAERMSTMGTFMPRLEAEWLRVVTEWVTLQRRP